MPCPIYMLEKRKSSNWDYIKYVFSIYKKIALLCPEIRRKLGDRIVFSYR